MNASELHHALDLILLDVIFLMLKEYEEALNVT